MSEPQTIDVRTLIPIERHKLLTKLFKEMKPGESFIFINDHDPKPLFYEFQSIYGDVVGWEYLTKGGIDWTVKVTRTGESVARETVGVSTLMDLRRVAEGDVMHAVFHRYGMMAEGDTMELIAAEMPLFIRGVFLNKHRGKCKWEVKKEEPGEVVIHVTKFKPIPVSGQPVTLVKTYDVRPFQPAKRHDIFDEAFAQLEPGEAFEFINDHDPKPLYYQLEAEQKVPFRWEYVESGPVDWRVRVSKLRE